MTTLPDAARQTSAMAAAAPAPKPWSIYISLRTKLVLLFMLLLGVLLVGGFVWIRDFATRTAIEDVRRDLTASALAASAAIDGDAHQALYESGDQNSPTYLAMNGILRNISRTNPKAVGLYTYVQDPTDPARVQFVVSSALPAGVAPTALDTAIAARRDPACVVPEEGAPLGYQYEPGPNVRRGLTEPAASTSLRADEFGTWLSGFAPLTSSSGAIVGAVGVDMCAGDVIAVESAINRTLIPAFSVAFVVILGASFLFLTGISRRLNTLTRTAEQIGGGNYNVTLKGLQHDIFGTDDEVTTLAGVFEIMLSKVRQREETLKKQVADLQIIIDETKRDKHVEEIVDSDFFRDLQGKARGMRSKRGPEATENNPIIS